MMDDTPRQHATSHPIRQIRRDVAAPRPACSQLTAVAAAADAPINVGSKAFTESVILGEVVASSLGARGATDVRHTPELGGTRIVYNALLRGDVDV
jgi:osmoprotectant transport system permease protein